MAASVSEGADKQIVLDLWKSQPGRWSQQHCAEESLSCHAHGLNGSKRHGNHGTRSEAAPQVERQCSGPHSFSCRLCLLATILLPLYQESNPCKLRLAQDKGKPRFFLQNASMWQSLSPCSGHQPFTAEEIASASLKPNRQDASSQGIHDWCRWCCTCGSVHFC